MPVSEKWRGLRKTVEGQMILREAESEYVGYVTAAYVET